MTAGKRPTYEISWYFFSECPQNTVSCLIQVGKKQWNLSIESSVVSTSNL